jgi:DNA-binding PadR family transcriptional regulator
MGDNGVVKALVNARAALLLALCEGPGHGAALAQRVHDRSRQQIRLGHGGVYSALSELQRAGLVRGWVVAPGRRRGARARRTYELTAKGIEVAERQRLALRGVAGIADGPDPVEMVEMRERLRQASDLSAAVLSLREAMPK